MISIINDERIFCSITNDYDMIMMMSDDCDVDVVFALIIDVNHMTMMINDHQIFFMQFS